jgi:hypothetical protein
MENKPNEPQPPRKGTIAGLFVGFLPSVILISLFGGSANHLSSSGENTFLWLAFAASLVCCLVSSALLFRRGTGGAVTGAVLLLLLNGFIAFFLGCCASLKF